MNRSLELGLACALVGAAAYGLGRLSGAAAPETDPTAPAAEVPAAGAPAEVPSGALDQAQLDALQVLGYMPGGDDAGAVPGVSQHDPTRAAPGLNLVYGAHEMVAELRDAQGSVVHTWPGDPDVLFPGHGKASGPGGTWCFRRAKLFDNGDLLALVDDTGIVRMDRTGAVLWAVRGSFHHDLDLTPDGDIVAIAATGRAIEAGKPDAIVDQIVILGPDGQEKSRTDLYDAFHAGSYDIVFNISRTSGDIMHTNTVQWLDGQMAQANPAFAEGNVLVTARNLNLAFVVDLAAKQVVWQWLGPWRYPHETTVLDPTTLMVLDNRGHFGMSKVFEVDVRSLVPTWSYEGTEANGFYTALCGALQRLDNGNTLVTSSDEGRAFEITREGEIVWQWITEDTVETKSGQKIARIHEVRRVPVPDWLPSAPAD